MSDNIQHEESNLDDLIEQLPDQFPTAVEMIKYDITPHLIECNPGVKDHYIKIIKKRTNAASIKSVSMLIDETIKEIIESVSVSGQGSGDDTVIDPEVIMAAEQIAKDPMLFKKKIDIINQLGVINERKNIGLYHLVIDSRLVPMGSAGSEALAMKNSGHYGAGKSYPLFMCLKLYPKSAYHLISSASEKSLYSIEGGLKYKALILAEALALESHGNRDNELAYGIRTLVSEGHLKYQYTGFKDKKRVTIVKKIEGPTSLLTTTIRGKLEDQLDDRMINAHPNTSATQTKDIIEQTAETASGNATRVDEKTLKAFQHFHDSLLSVEVVIPFAKDIAAFVTQKGSLPIAARRAYKRVLSSIKTLTLMNQKQRGTDGMGRCIAEYCDYSMAYQLIGDAYMESIGNARRYTDKRIKLIERNGKIMSKDLAEAMHVSGAAISQWMKPLVKKGILMWVDEADDAFADVESLEKAKRSGKAYIQVGHYNRLPTPFELTGNPDWDIDGELYRRFDLELGDASAECFPSNEVDEESYDIPESSSLFDVVERPIEHNENPSVNVLIDNVVSENKNGNNEDEKVSSIDSDVLFKDFQKILLGKNSQCSSGKGNGQTHDALPPGILTI
jgi:DNA primase